MAKKLEGKTIAVLIAKGVEQVELEEPIKALKKEGAQVKIVSPESGKVRAWQKGDWGDSFDVDVSLSRAEASDYQALLIPGGVMSPDHLREHGEAVEFVRAFFEGHKPVASICHGPWMLAEADVVRGRKLTSYPSLKTDLKNAGANWVDREVVVDSGLVTSRSPADLRAFCDKMVEEFCEGKHDEQKAERGGKRSGYPSPEEEGPRASL